MQLHVSDVNELLIQEDVEGFIELGAPHDEYESEAALIAAAILQLKENERTEDAILSVMAIIWMNNFNLGDDEMQHRIPALRRIAQEILKK
ncbi:MAG: hypothetical protein SFW64_07495 [Alphaproteobacteria bacterium]|nr:hypothetical protein [Alphaproteobacteria bacterium]